jgi:hypothetical protein
MAREVRPPESAPEAKPPPATEAILDRPVTEGGQILRSEQSNEYFHTERSIVVENCFSLSVETKSNRSLMNKNIYIHRALPYFHKQYSDSFYFVCAKYV